MPTRYFGKQRFRELSQLGVGGMGVVYEVLDCERNLTLALKTLRTLDPKQLLRFKNEFRALCDIRHPNLVELHELFEEDGSWFFTMEVVDGVDFISFVRRDETGFDEQRMRRALRGLGAGLAALHRAGKVHCDVKPSNVLVTEEARAVLLDFGVVTELSATGSADNPRAGSPLYVAPEQSAGKSVGPAADWYAAGVLLFRALTGRVPFSGRDAAEVIRRKQRESPPHPLDIEPELPQDLADLCARLIARNILHRPSEVEILEILGVGEEHVRQLGETRMTDYRLFVGRGEPLAKLASAYADSQSGRAVSVVIEGESGVGKTALVERFTETLEREHYVHVFRGQCHEREFVRYNALDGIVDGIARFLRDPRYVSNTTGSMAESVVQAVDDVGPLLNLFPVLRHVPQWRDEDTDTVGDVRAQAFTAVKQLFAGLAARMPLVVVMDDIHWADADSLELLRELMGGRGGVPMLLLATARKLDNGESCPALAVLGRDVRTIELAGLPVDEAEDLAYRLWQRRVGRRSSTGVTGRAGQWQDPWERSIAELVEETGGHPLFMDELVRYLVRHGEAHVSGQRAQLDHALRERIDELDARAQRILQLTVVAGMPIAYDIVARCADLPATDLADGLSALRRANLVRMQGRDRHAQLTVYHARVSDAVYREMSAELRMNLHTQMALAMEDAGMDAVHLANHYHRGGRAHEAARYAVQAARDSIHALAFEQAAELYQLALQATPVHPENERVRIELLTALGSSLENAGRVKQAAEAYLVAAAHVQGLLAGAHDGSQKAGDESELRGEWLELHRRAAQQLLAGGYLEEGIATVAQVLERSGIKLPKSGRRALPSIAWNFFRLTRHDLVWRRPSAEELARPQTRRALHRIDVCWTAGAGLSLVDTVRGIFFAVQGARMALRQGEPYRVARSLCMSAVAASALGERESAARMTEAAGRAAREHGSAQAIFYAETAAFVYHFFYQQKWSECVECGRRLEALWREAGHVRGSEIDFVVQFYSWALAMRGDITALTDFYDDLVGDARRMGNRLLEVSLRVYHFLVRLARDEPMRAEDDIRAAIASWQPDSDAFYLQHAWALFSLGNIRLYRGEPEREYELRAEFKRLKKSPLRRTLWVVWRETFLNGRFALALAHRARIAGESSQRASELARATTMAKRLASAEAPVPRAWATLLRAGVCHLEGDAEGALAQLERAHQGFCATESALYQAAARYRQGQVLGGDEGMGYIQEARTMLRQCGVTRPENIVAMLAPGWGL